MRALKRLTSAGLIFLAASSFALAQSGGSSTGGGGGSGGGQGGGVGQGGSTGAGGAGGPGEQGAEQKGAEQKGGGAGGPQMPPPVVTVVTAEAKTIPITYEYAARVAASREVEVRARVGGIILERTFEEGSRVAANQVLFRIDPREYQAQVQAAQASIAQAQAQLTNARRTEDRQRQLVQSGASSTATLDEAVANRQLAEAQLASANAQLYTANLSLTFATVNSPVAGITSREQVPEGSLVATNDLLTRVSQLDPIYVNFSAADTEAFQIRRLIESGAAGNEGVRGLTAQVVFGDGSTYDRMGSIDFTSATIDADTGTISSRAVFPNPQQQLLPGQFVRIAIRGLVLDNAIEIPATALMQNPDGQYVFTIDDKNVAQVRPITVGREMNERIIVATGLKPGDRVVTEGVVKVRPGAPVKPAQPQQAGGQPPAGANAAETASQAPSGSGGAEGANQPQRTNADGSTPAADSASGTALGSGVQARGPAQAQGGGPVDDTGSQANDENVKAGKPGDGAAGGAAQ